MRTEHRQLGRAAVTLDGRVVGVNIAGGTSVETIGFAIPIDAAMPLLIARCSRQCRSTPDAIAGLALGAQRLHGRVALLGALDQDGVLGALGDGKVGPDRGA